MKYAILKNLPNPHTKSGILQGMYLLRWMQGVMDRKERKPHKQRCRLSSILLSRQPTGNIVAEQEHSCHSYYAIES